MEVTATDGTYLHLNPDDWEHFDDVAPTLESHLPADRVVPYPHGATYDSILSVARSRLTEPERSSDELKDLPGRLLDDETVQDLAAARCAGHVGLLVLSNRRLLFLDWAHPSEDRSIGRERVASCDQEADRLTLETTSDRFLFEAIDPKGRAAELAAKLAESDLEP